MESDIFVEGLKKLTKECKLDSVDYIASGVTKYYFKDGSSIDALKLAKDVGWLDDDDIDRANGIINGRV